MVYTNNDYYVKEKKCVCVHMFACACERFHSLGAHIIVKVVECQCVIGICRVSGGKSSRHVPLAMSLGK